MVAPEPQWKKDGKRLPGNAVSAAVSLSVLAAAFPVYLLTMFPVAVVAQIFKAMTKKVAIRRKPAEGEDRLEIAAADRIPREKRTYDVVFLGATGFTGKLGCKYLAAQYGKSGSKITWAIAGRRQAALEDIRKEVGQPDLPIVICDTNNPDNLRELVRDTRCVVTTAGPFNLYGTGVVKYCANYGTHYADITGEDFWVRETIDRFDGIAKETGARIVHFCGHDSVPWDLMAMLAAEKLKKEHGSELASVEMYDRIRAAPSGGTLATIFSVLEAKSKYAPSLDYDPMLMTHNKEKSWANTVFTGLKAVAYSKREKAWTSMFVMARCNSEVVRRSNALNAYGENVTYYEAAVHTDCPSAVLAFVRLLVLGAIITCPPLLALARKYVFPKPGEGPSVKSMDAGFLEVTCYAKGTKKDAEVEGKMYFKTDPGYRDTARMLVEAGLALALTDPAKLPGSPGVLTSASGIGQPYVDRLCATGTTVTWA